jgi:hypothetical protein
MAPSLQQAEVMRHEMIGSLAYQLRTPTRQCASDPCLWGEPAIAD